jgi:hypothetical protein
MTPIANKPLESQWAQGRKVRNPCRCCSSAQRRFQHRFSLGGSHDCALQRYAMILIHPTYGFITRAQFFVVVA